MTAVNGVNNIQGRYIDPSQYYQNSYAAQVLNSDESLMGLSPIGGEAYINNNSTIFGNGFGTYPGFGGGIMGGMGYGMGCGMGYGPGSEVMNMSQIDYLKYQEKMENYQIDKQVRQQKKVASAEFSATGAEDALTRQIGVLQRKIKQNEQDSVLQEYNKLVQLAEHKLREGGYVNGQVSKEQVKAYAEKLYFEATGKSVVNDLTENGDSGFVQGLKQGAFGAGFLFANKKNYEDNVSAITGEAKNSTSSTWKAVGTGVSALLTGSLAVFGLIKGGKAIKARF